MGIYNVLCVKWTMNLNNNWVLERLTDRNDYDINDTESDIIEKLIQVETDEIVLHESAR